MNCYKEGYSKAHAHKMRENIYKKSKRNTKLRIYYCPDCHLYHLTSSIDGDEWLD